MSDAAVLEQLIYRQTSLANQVKNIAAGLSEAQFRQVPGDNAPPMGCHLWHVARWSDRFQASFLAAGDATEIWASERMNEVCGLDPADLGVLGLGMSMDTAKAARLPSIIGRDRFLTYLNRVLDAGEAALSRIDAADLLAPRLSIREYASVNGVIQYAPPQKSTLLADILFHLTHCSRHLGSVEALRGLDR